MGTGYITISKTRRADKAVLTGNLRMILQPARLQVGIDGFFATEPKVIDDASTSSIFHP